MKTAILLTTILSPFLLPLPLLASIIPRQNASPQFTSYLISTFSDANPAIQWHLSTANSLASPFTFLNGGEPILSSTVGTRGVRDIYLTHDGARSKWFLLATDLDINAEGFNWDVATRNGSRGLVVWESKDLVQWDEGRLVE